MQEPSTKPYLIRAIYEWCADAGYTPYLAVAVDERTRVPTEYVKDGEIVLNIGASATRGLTMGNDVIQFSARFNGHSRELTVPVAAVIGIFARENGQGMFFPKGGGPEDGPPSEDGPDGGDSTPPKGKPRLQVVK